MSGELKEAINYLTNNMLLTDKSFPALQTLIRAAKRTAELEQRIEELEGEKANYCWDEIYHLKKEIESLKGFKTEKLRK